MRRLDRGPLLAIFAASASLSAACSPAAPAPAAPPPTASAQTVAPVCADGHSDCDGDPKNGCEADLSSPRTCGTCDLSCGAMESCLDGRCLREHRLNASTGACAIRDGRVHCWGHVPTDNDDFEASPEYTLPHALEGVEDAITVRFNFSNSRPICAVERSGKVKCLDTWLGSEPPDRTDAVDAAAYGPDTCVVAASGLLYCGKKRVPHVTGAIAVVASDDYFFVLRKDGHVIHVYTDLDSRDFRPAEIPGVEGAVDIAAAFHSLCILLASGKVLCSEPDAGPDRYREVQERPLLEVPGLSDAVAVDIGCAVRSSGEAVRWDRPGSAPKPIAGVKDAKRIACGADFGCYERADGAVLCWGNRRSGRLGDGAETVYPTPVTATTITDAVAVAAAYGTCALRKDGTVWCWGTQDHVYRRGIPAERVPGLEGVTSLIGSFHRACAVSGAKPVHCFPPELPLARVAVFEGLGDVKKAIAWDSWGVVLRADGEVVLFDAPDQAGTFRPAMLPIAGLRDAVDITADPGSVCAVRKNGTVGCAEIDGAVEALTAKGAGGTPVIEPPRVFVQRRVRDAVAIAGDIVMNFLRKSGTTVTFQGEPSSFDDLGGVTRLFGSRLTACAILKSGQVVCRGSSGDQSLRGTGMEFKPFENRPVKDIADAVDGAVGWDHACVVLATGKVACWGSNDGDALGGGDPPVSLVPVEVPLGNPPSPRSSAAP